MTVKKRLALSNILMIFVPVVSTTMIGLLCIGFLWIVVINGTGLDMHDAEDFNRVCLAVTETIEHKLENSTSFSSLEALLENNGMAVQVIYDGEIVYAYGNDADDDMLITAASTLAGNVSISQDGRNLYKTKEIVNGQEYIIYIFGGSHSKDAYSRLKVAIAMSVILIAFTIFLSVLFTNRFLIKFVFRRIEEPLTTLATGVHELRDGNLDYRINYYHEDEFLPICENFNEMAIRLKESVAKIQQQEKNRKELVAGISHDLRSPLTSIQAYVEGLLDGIATTPETQNAYLMTIKTKTLDLDHIISQLFLFSKMELGEYANNIYQLRLDEKILDVVSEVREEYAHKGLRLETNLCPVTINADPVQLERILTNIMENSLKYKTKEQGTLCITLRRSGVRCLLSFDDDGPGVSDESLPHLFDVFYRSDPSRNNPHSGSGLGLAIVKSAVGQMGGEVSASQSKMGGLEIRLNLPCEEVPHGEDFDSRG